MKVNVIHADGNEGYRALMYGPPTQDILGYISNSAGNAAARLGEYGSSFLERSNQILESINGSAAIARAKEILNYAGMTNSSEAIYFTNIDNVANANQTMRDWIMHEKTYRDLVNKNEANGFDDYNDLNPQLASDETSYYMDANDGWWTQSICDAGEDVNFFTHSHDTEDLDMTDTLSVQSTWLELRNSIAKGIDPIDGSEL